MKKHDLTTSTWKVIKSINEIDLWKSLSSGPIKKKKKYNQWFKRYKKNLQCYKIKSI